MAGPTPLAGKTDGPARRLGHRTNECSFRTEMIAPTGGRTSAVGKLLAGLAASNEEIAAELLVRLDPGDVGEAVVERADLLTAASREAERLGDIAVRLEHLVLGWVRVAEDNAAVRSPRVAGVDRAREELQLPPRSRPRQIAV